MRREAYGEAWKEAPAGRDIEPRKLTNRVPTLFAYRESNICVGDKSRAEAERGVVEDPGTSRNSMHENRETCSAPVNQADRSAKAQSRTADAYVLQESDRCVVPMKLPNTEEHLRRR